MSTIQATQFLALAEPTRLGIIDLLAIRGELSASDISSRLKSSASAISHHLKVLREAKLVIMRKKAQQRIYQLDTATMIELEAWINTRTRQWNSRIDTMDDYLQQLKQNNI